MLDNFSVPQAFMPHIGSLYSVEMPPQGTAFNVFILTSSQGRFVLKKTSIPGRVKSLHKEVTVLNILQGQVPFVAIPLAHTQEGDEYSFLFTCVEGEPLYVTLRTADTQERSQLIVQYAQALYRVHNWNPIHLPRPEPWLSETLAQVSAYILAQPVNALITNTNSRFDGYNAHTLLTELQEGAAEINEDLVFGHGDYCLPNVLVHNGKTTGVIDWSGGGYMDRRFDLAVALFSMRLSEALQQQDVDYETMFLHAYGYAESLETLLYFEKLHALTCAFW